MKLLPTNLVLLFSVIFINSRTLLCLQSSKCSKDLEKIIYKPDTCALKYFEKISADIKASSQVFFTPEADSFIYAFENAFNVNLTLVDALGHTMNYYPNKTKSAGWPVIYADVAQSYLNLPGFARQVSCQTFYYTFAIFSKEGQYYGVTLSMPLSKDPVFC